jgi:hypothetical protein
MFNPDRSHSMSNHNTDRLSRTFSIVIAVAVGAAVSASSGNGVGVGVAVAIFVMGTLSNRRNKGS